MRNPIQQETLCCNRKRCPTVTLFDDGSMQITDDDPDNGSVGTINLTPEQAARLVEISKQGK